MSVSYWQDSASKTQEYDYVVVGAGIAGVAQCYWLRKTFPQAKIALLDRFTLASGASGRNAGFVTCGSIEHLMKMSEQQGFETALEIWRFSEENHHLMQQEILQTAQDIDDVDYRALGSCTVAPNEARWQDYKSFIAKAQAAGVAMQEIDEKEIRQDFSLSGFIGAAFYQKDGSIHPLKLIHKILARTQVDLIENCEVRRLEENKNVTLWTNQGVLKANNVFLTLNAYLPLLLPEFSSLLVPARGQILTTEPVPFSVRGPCYFTKSLCYFRQLRDGRLLVGGFRNIDHDAEETYTDAVNPKIHQALADFVTDHFPISKDFKVSHQWSGTMSFAKDGQLLLGPRVPGSKVIVHAGCSGHGMGLNFHAAKVLCESLENKQAIPDFFRLERFA